MNSLDEILIRLQGRQPASDNEEQLIEEIMASLPEKKPIRRRSLWQSTLLSAATVAAALLMFVYVNERNRELSMQAFSTDGRATVRMQFADGSTPKQVYEYYKRRKSQQFLNFVQLKNKLHENF